MTIPFVWKTKTISVQKCSCANILRLLRPITFWDEKNNFNEGRIPRGVITCCSSTKTFKVKYKMEEMGCVYAVHSVLSSCDVYNLALILRVAYWVSEIWLQIEHVQAAPAPGACGSINLHPDEQFGKEARYAFRFSLCRTIWFSSFNFRGEEHRLRLFELVHLRWHVQFCAILRRRESVRSHQYHFSSVLFWVTIQVVP